MKRNFIITVCLLLGFLTSCIDEAEKVPTDIVTNAAKPVLSEIGFVGKTASTVTWKGKVVEAKGYTVTERGISWSTSFDMDFEKDSRKSLTDNSSDSIRLTAENLKGSTKYYFRLYAINKHGTGFSNIDSTSTNDGLGSVRTFIDHEQTRATTAVAGGLIDSRGEGTVVERGVYYALSENMTPKDSVINSTELDSFRCNLSGLKPSTIYYIQAYVKNTYGLFKGKVDYVKTGSGMPILNEILRIDPETNKAQVIGEVISIGDAPLTRRGFCWNKRGDPKVTDNILTVSLGSLGGKGHMAADLQPLESNQIYHVCAFAENQFGISYGVSKSFVTNSDIPTVITLDPIDMVDGSAIFKGNVINTGENNVVRIGFCYSATNPNPSLRPESSDTKVVELTTLPISNVPYPFSSGVITGLRGESSYHIRAFAVNGNGRPSYGDPVILHTPPIFTQESESFIGEVCGEGSSAYFTIGEKGFLLGGDIGPAYINNLFSYNPASSLRRWWEFNSYPAAMVKWLSVAVYDTRVYVLGGLGTGRVAKNDFYVYNTVDNMWFPRPTGPDSAYLRAGFSLNNEVVYVGGMKDTANCEVWAYNVSLNSWSQKADFPVNQYGGIALTIDNNVYAGLGKNTSGVGNKQLWRSSGTLASWSPEPSGTELVGNVLAGVVFNKKIYVIDKSWTIQRYTLFEYNPANQEWKRKSTLPGYSWDILFMYSIGGRIYIGFAGDKVVAYDPLWDN